MVSPPKRVGWAAVGLEPPESGRQTGEKSTLKVVPRPGSLSTDSV